MIKCIFITQNEPFYLRNTFEVILNELHEDIEVTGVVLLDPSPFGKKFSIIQKYFETLKIFGLKFCVYYFIKLVQSKLGNRSVKSLLEKHNIPIIKLNSSINSTESLEKIKSFDPDILISIAGNQIFKKDLINLADLGCLNLHTSLLPKYRGLMPTFWVLKNKEKETGVSVFYVDEGIDSGEIILQKKIYINKMTQEELIKKTKHMGALCVVESLNLIRKGAVKLIPNDDNKMSYYGFPSRKDVIEFKKAGAKFF